MHTHRARVTDAPHLRDILRERGLSIAEMARRAGLPYGTAARVVFEYQHPSEPTRDAIGRALGMKPSRIWPDAKPLVSA